MNGISVECKMIESNNLLVYIDIHSKDYVYEGMSEITPVGSMMRISIDADNVELDNSFSIILDMINETIEDYALNSTNVILVGGKAAGSFAMLGAYKLDCNYLAVSPLLNRSVESTAFNLLKKLGVPVNSYGGIADDISYRGHGKIIYSCYDAFDASYDATLVKHFQRLKNVQLITLEDYFSAYTIKSFTNKLHMLLIKEINAMLDALTRGVNYSNINLVPTATMANGINEFDMEQIHQEIVEGTKVCIKYREDITHNNDILYVVLSEESKEESSTFKDATEYYLDCLRRSAVNAVLIRSTFGKTGGLHLFDEAVSNVNLAMISFIEKKRKELNIESSNVIIIGAGKTAISALYYCKKANYKNVFLISPDFNLNEYLENNYIDKNKYREIINDYIKINSFDFNIQIINIDERKGSGNQQRDTQSKYQKIKKSLFKWSNGIEDKREEGAVKVVR